MKPTKALVGQMAFAGCQFTTSWKQVAQAAADARLRPIKPQQPCEFGLFGETRRQEELFTPAKGAQ